MDTQNLTELLPVEFLCGFFFFFFLTFLSSIFGLFLPFCDFDCTILHFDINLSKKLRHSSLASLSAPCSSTASECPSFSSPHCLWADCVQLLDRNEINKSTFFYYIFQNLKHGAVNTGTFFFFNTAVFCDIHTLGEMQAGGDNYCASSVRTCWYYPAFRYYPEFLTIVIFDLLQQNCSITHIHTNPVTHPSCNE